MPINAVWGDGGSVAGGSGIAVGTDFEPEDGQALSVDGTPLPLQVVIGQGGSVGGGEAEVS